MPELVEVERYRSLAEATALGRPIVGVDATDAWYLKRGAKPAEVAATLVGERLVAARRRGKLLMLDLSGGSVLGLRFGMSGRLVVDGLAGVGNLIADEVLWRAGLAPGRPAGALPGRAVARGATRS